MCPQTHWPRPAFGTSFTPPPFCSHRWAQLSSLPRDVEQSCCSQQALCWVLLGEASWWPPSQRRAQLLPDTAHRKSIWEQHAQCLVGRCWLCVCGSCGKRDFFLVEL